MNYGITRKEPQTADGALLLPCRRQSCSLPAVSAARVESASALPRLKAAREEVSLCAGQTCLLYPSRVTNGALNACARKKQTSSLAKKTIWLMQVRAVLSLNLKK